MKLALPLLLLVLLAPAAIVGFGFGDDLEANDGGEVRFAVSSDVKTLDPQRSTALNDFRIIDNLFETLLRVDTESLELIPAAAEAMPTVSDDGTTFTFRIRADAKWSNGDTLTSHDFKFAWMRALLPDLAAGYSGKFLPIKGAKAFFDWRADALEQALKGGPTGDELWRLTLTKFDDMVGLHTPDDRTLVVELEGALPYFADLAGFGPFSPVHRQTALDALMVDATTGRVTSNPGIFIDPDRIVSNGPYKLVEWSFGRRLVADANEHYWNRDAVQNGRFIQHVVRDEALQMMMFESGELDWLPSIPTSSPLAAELVKTGRPDAHTHVAAGTYYYIFNTRAEYLDGTPNPLVDARLRQGLSLAIDRSLLVERVTQMNQPIASTFVPPGSIFGYDAPTEAGLLHDPTRARELFAQAGYGPGGKTLSLTFVYNTGGGHEKPAQAIAQMWRDELGVSVSTQAVEWNTLIDLRNKGDFVTARGGWFGDYTEPSTFLELFKTGDGNNDSGYASEEFDRLLAAAKAAPTPEERMRLYREAEQVMLADAPIAPLYHYTNLDIYDPNRLQGVDLNPWRSPPMWKMRIAE